MRDSFSTVHSTWQMRVEFADLQEPREGARPRHRLDRPAGADDAVGGTTGSAANPVGEAGGVTDLLRTAT